jgi:hypothetical protein
MIEEELAKSRRLSAREILSAIPGGHGHRKRVEFALEVAMNTEWWRGFWAGRYHEGRVRPPSVTANDVLSPQEVGLDDK